ncbi:molybdopterin cofactor-binding domain-containing protein [Streptomyces sp. NPDC005485]|uniref:xanthine dehydrogenase family protein molybdopterin-binding subunit n=1 Tax=Streptomyces sp. NPDC005485 TaxID=3155591 RepID=UPI0033A0FAD3
MVYALAATTLTLATPATADALPADALPRAAETPAVSSGSSGVIVANRGREMLGLEVTEANKVVVRLPRAEVGQGITTAVAMMIAEELDARLADVEIPLADADPRLENQFTGGSSSVSSLYDPARRLAATARARLVTAAARQWKVPARTLRTHDTTVVAPDGRTATFGSLSAAAARLRHADVPAWPKPASRHTVIGHPTTRIDARDIVTGKATYAGDLHVAGALPTVVARPPTLGGKVSALDAAAARALPGVRAVVRVPGGVAVVAESFHHAFRARDALRITWTPGPLAALSDTAIRSRLRAAVPDLAAPPHGSRQVQGEFEFAFVSHAPMEVLTAIADVREHRAELWFSSQSPGYAQAEIAATVGLPESAVKVHVVRGGGSFGRRLNHDAALEAALISKKAHLPVKLMWSRNDDMRHGRMRPASHHLIRASHKDGRVVAFAHHMASVNESAGSGVATTARQHPRAPRPGAAAPLPSNEGLYNFGSVKGDWGGIELAMPLGAWRSVDSGTSRTAEEIVVDEVARSLRRDPVAFRRTTLRSKSVRAVLDKVAAAGRWGRELPAGHGQGVAVHEEYGSCVAALAEIDASDPAHPRVTRVVMAADVGTVVNPRGLDAQLMGAAIDGISTILRAGLHIDRGAVREGSFSDFHYARQRHSPWHFEAHLMPSTEEPGGAGELGVPAAAGAVANAYARATGRSPRRFPLTF